MRNLPKWTNEGSRSTTAELATLQVLWEHGPPTVRQVHEALAGQSSDRAGYSTTLKLMQIMGEGLASRDQSARTHIYAARLPQQTAVMAAISCQFPARR